MKKSLFILIAIGLSACSHPLPVVHHTPQSKLPVWDSQYKTTYVAAYDSGQVEKGELENVQCPIPMKDRVRNYTGVQCVFSSIETLGRWAECKPLISPPLTSRSDCKSFSSPNDAGLKLKALGVRFEQSYRGQEQGIVLIKKAMREGRGCLFGVPGHAMVLIHYDDEADVVKWIDNSDSRLRVQTMTVKQFRSKWDQWILVIYADPDIIAAKLNRKNLANQIPIINRNSTPETFPDNYIPTPME